MAIGTKVFDAADYLDDVETIRYFLQDAFAEGDPADIANSLRAVVRARGGMAKVAGQIGLEEEALSAELSLDSGPKVATLVKILETMGLTLSMVQKSHEAKAA